ncbi:hypothetical protein HDV00_004800 [Rhizophlyctis rosea]|nr:hypothetical protein HDV00_004800 [Rhizophlyctis rosea]
MATKPRASTLDSLSFGKPSTAGFGPITPATPGGGMIGDVGAGGAGANVPEERRTSLLDVVRANLQRQGKTTMLYRVIVSGQLPRDADRAELGAYYQKFFKQYQTETDLITGMLLVFPGCFVHILEASHKVILSFLRDLATPKPPPSILPPRQPAPSTLHSHHTGSSTSQPSTQPTSTNSLQQGTPSQQQQQQQQQQTAHHKTKNVKVLCMVDDIAARFYPFWASRVVDPKAVDVDIEVDTEEGRAKTVANICINIATLGTTLSALTKPLVITRLSGRNDVMSVDQWCEVFDGHTSLALESGE